MQFTTRYLRILFLILCLGMSPALFSQSSASELKVLISKNLNGIGITKNDVDNFIINNNYQDKASGIEHVYIQQTYKDIKVFNAIISLSFKNGSLLYSSGKFLNTATSFGGIVIPVIEAKSAVSNTARHLKLIPVSTIITKKNNFKVDKKIVFTAEEISKKDIETELLWAQDDSGKVHLVWNVSIDVKTSNDWWNVRVDAITGEIVSKDNWTVHEKFTESDDNLGKDHEQPVITSIIKNIPKDLIHPGKSPVKGKSTFFAPPNIQNAAYLVVPFPGESRNFGAIAVDNNPWLKTGETNNATTYGWHFDGTTNYSITRGNNVYAYDDSSNTNNPGRYVTSSSQPPIVNFNVSPDFAIQPFDSTNRNFGIVNLFYWNNILHDLSYQYGFTEAAGNFQADNLGRGGNGNDYVKAEAQDGAGTDNAMFNSPPDGSNGRMEMYLFTAPPQVFVTAPGNITGNYTSTESQLSANNKLAKVGPKSGDVELYNDGPDPGATHEACDSSKMPANSVAGKIAMLYRGACPFTTKMRAAQKAGAIAVLMVNNVPGTPIGFGGTDNQVTIPAIMVSQDDGLKLANELPTATVSLTMTSGIYLDGGIDNGVVTHEFGHGVSNRLTGGRTNSSCLSNAEQGGEGWSDYLALMFTTNWQNTQTSDGPKPRSIGTYTSSQAATGKGIRRVPYSTDMNIDTLTYYSMDGNATVNGEVHNIGEIWCSALWDMTWNIIQHEGALTPDMYNSAGTGGNILALNLVMEGMKLQPCRPGFLDARNAILAADSILYNFRHKCDIWNAFARRGMGYSAQQGLSTSTADQVPAFDVPAAISINKTMVTSVINAGSENSYNTIMTCECQVPADSYTVSDTIPAGFTYITSNGGTLLDNVVQFSPVSFTSPLQSITLTTTLKATGTACKVTQPLKDDREANQSGELISGRITGTTNWMVSQNHYFSTTNAWYAADAGASSNFTLTSATFVPGNLSIFSFWHYFVTEIYLDGGRVEISQDDGSNWIDANPYFLQNGYNGKLNGDAPQPNTNAFTGTSYATSSTNNGQFIESVIDLSSFANQSIRIRFRFQTNNSNAFNQTYDGWYIDDIAVTNGCGGISKTAFLNSSGNKIDSFSRPFFNVSNDVLPLQLLNFSAKQTGKEVWLNWETSAEINTKNFDIERSADGINWTKIGSVSSKERSSNSYSFSDNNPLENLGFYRIKINDLDGKFTYTLIKKLEFSSDNILSVVPNPVVNSATLYFGFNSKGNVISITDLQGRIIQTHIINDNTGSYIISVSNFPVGTYIIRMQSKKGITTKKMIVGH